ILEFYWSSLGTFPKMIVPREALYDISNQPTAFLTSEGPELFALGDTLIASGEAMDSEGIPIPPENFTWTIYLVSPDTSVVLNTAQGIDSLYYPVPDSLDYIDGSRMLIYLEARDSNGFPAHDTRELDPILSTVRIHGEIEGTSVILNNEVASTPQEITVIQGFHFHLEVLDTFLIRERVMYVYSDWPATDPINFHVP